MVVQFTLSVFLITGAVTMLKQLRFIGNKDLGYEKENIICLSLIRLYYAESYNLTNKMKSLKQELLNNPDITAVSASTDIPCSVGWSITYLYGTEKKVMIILFSTG